MNSDLGHDLGMFFYLKWLVSVLDDGNCPFCLNLWGVLQHELYCIGSHFAGSWLYVWFGIL